MGIPVTESRLSKPSRFPTGKSESEEVSLSQYLDLVQVSLDHLDRLGEQDLETQAGLTSKACRVVASSPREPEEGYNSIIHPGTWT